MRNKLIWTTAFAAALVIAPVAAQAGDREASTTSIIEAVDISPDVQALASDLIALLASFDPSAPTTEVEIGRAHV